MTEKGSAIAKLGALRVKTAVSGLLGAGTVFSGMVGKGEFPVGWVVDLSEFTRDASLEQE